MLGRRHCRLRWLRVFVLALFALGLVLQPVLAAVGEIHELAHDPSGSHAHVEHSHDIAAELTPADAQDEEGAKTLHTLLHLAHCCGQATAAMLAGVKTVAAAPAMTQPAMTPPQIALQARLLAPFRPPISA